eukprot:160888_1
MRVLIFSMLFRFQRISYNLIGEARVPVIKDASFAIPVDIVILDEHTRERTDFMLTRVNADPNVARLTRTVRYWAKKRGIGRSGQGGLSTFGWSLMVMKFLE